MNAQTARRREGPLRSAHAAPSHGKALSITAHGLSGRAEAPVARRLHPGTALLGPRPPPSQRLLARTLPTCGSQARCTDEATPRRGSRLPPAVCLQVRFLPTLGHLSSTRRRIQVRQQDSQQDAFPAVASGGDLLTFPPFRAPAPGVWRTRKCSGANSE